MQCNLQPNPNTTLASNPALFTGMPLLGDRHWDGGFDHGHVCNGLGR